ncbi:MAG: Hint domain-containing protein [Candidatus Omnitrophota bacterium]
MKNLIRKRNGFTIEEMLTAVTVITLVVVLTLPVVVRVMTNIRNETILVTLRALLEAQRSYRDTQTPTTYANAIQTLVNENYVADPTRYGLTFSVASATADTFTIEVPKYGGGGCFSIDQKGAIASGTCSGGVGGVIGGGVEDATAGGCFLKGTPVLMADGRTLPIERVKAGDNVTVFDQATGGFKQSEVKELLVHDAGEHNADRYLIINGYLRVTPNHPVYSNGKWVHIGELGVGDVLLGQDGKPFPIRSIQVVMEHVKVYNFHEVDRFHTYIAGGVVVHNGECVGNDCGDDGNTK